MKFRTVFRLERRQCRIMLIVSFILLIAIRVDSSSAAEPLDHREVYLNGSSYIRMHTPLTLQTQIGLSFRTCAGGELFSQKHVHQSNGHMNSIKLSVNSEGLIFTSTTNGKHYETKILDELLDNRWHTVILKYVLENFTIQIGKITETIANKTYSPELLTNPVFYNEAILIVGNHFNGCLLEGPSILFQDPKIVPYGNIQFGLCPLPLNNCMAMQELMMPPSTGHQDFCKHNPCMMQGTCESRFDKYVCHCTARYAGKNCEIDQGSPCDKKLCKNGATCNEDARGDYTCTCPPLFTGTHCEQRISSSTLCDTNPCFNGGICKMNASGSKECTCLLGFEGPQCEINVDECKSNPCFNGGVCKDSINGFMCDCSKTGYRGIQCEEDINECVFMKPCKNGATCFNTYGSYTCSCVHGFDGINCELNLNECVTQPCSNRGTCIDKLGGYDCNCVAGYTGKNCDMKLSSCDSSSCPPYADCVEHGSDYKCICKPGISSGQYPNCTSEASTCHPNPCKNGGSCSYHMGTYNCTCLPGFAGPNCEQQAATGSCPCQNGATCINDQYTYRCNCPESFTGALCEHRFTCVDNPCMHATSCRDYSGGYYCNCIPGWTGFNCDVDINRCQSDPCRNGATCLNSPAADYTCQCAPGFTGKQCTVSLGECASSPCVNGGTCTEQSTGGYFCNCTKDFMGKNCEKPYSVCDLIKPCKNNGTCTMPQHNHDYHCECSTGFDGPNCEHNIDDCVHVECPAGKVCIDLVNDHVCQCPDGFGGENCSVEVNPCARRPCKNNATCSINPLSQEIACHCLSGWKGKFCEQDIDECLETHSDPPLCGSGLCKNLPGEYQCYCLPGFTGTNCNIDIDECLPKPCKNNATCIDEINNFTCACTPGYTGRDCSIDIDECAVNPCTEGSTCIDMIADFTCICQSGYTGKRCEINIDDCANMPCLNNGKCEDLLNNYTCNCADTGYSGMHCEINIDDCLSNPCQNGAECIDGIKDYTCKCYDGYTGKNCEEDINECTSSPCKNNGTCLQRSDKSLYYPQAADRQLNVTAFFKKDFSYAEAAGYECVCIPGATGANCEIDINDCESNPCINGQCIDKLGYYECDCDEGFEGEYCEVDIDECEIYHPCQHGVCKDRRANYFCECDSNYGGKNCSVELTGCNASPCLNNGSCKPYLENEKYHKFNCTCPNGYHGHSCELITTMSMTGKSYVNVNTTREEGYDISFRFRTTLSQGLLAMGSGATFYILELSHGRLNLHSSLLNKWDGVFVGSNLNDSNWQKVFVAINATHLVLSANEEQTIYPIFIPDGSNSSSTSFPTTYLGGTEKNLKNLVHGPDFIGCQEDVVINGQWVLPKNNSWINLTNVEVGCPRVSQCNPNPCHSGGHCIDNWRTFHCTCARPYLGTTCQYNYTAATFGHENITNSLVTVTADDQSKRAIRSIVDISMFIRTRQMYGQIFYLGSSLNPDETYIAAQLEKGELLVRIQFNGTPEAYTVGGVQLNNGYNHLIEVIRNVTLVQVKINGTEYFRKTISSTGQLDAQVLFLGGQPPARTIRQAISDSNILLRTDTTPPTGPVAVTTPLSLINFKGIIQDVQISNGSYTMVVEFFPLGKSNDLYIPKKFGSVEFDHGTVLKGVLSDDSCKSNPCKNGTCVNTWNDYKCECTRGYKGKDCDELEFCQVHECPRGSQCRNLDDGYECISNITLNGEILPAMYNFVVPTLEKDKLVFNNLEIAFRTKTGGTVLFAKSLTNYFVIFVSYDYIVVEWKIDSYADKKIIKKENYKGDWITLYFRIKDSIISGGTKESVVDEIPNFTAQMSVVNFTSLFVNGQVYIGGSDSKTFNVQKTVDSLSMLTYNTSFTATDDVDNLGNTVEIPEHTTDLPMRRIDMEDMDKRIITDKFKGCIGEIRVGDLLLPFFKTDEIYNDTENLQPKHYFDLENKTSFLTGCILCYQQDCKFGGLCENPEDTYACKCLPGFAKDDCSENIDECLNSNCANNSTCIDGIGNYTCDCDPGYQGWLCDEEIDECLSNPCRNAGTCEDLLNDFQCVCPDEYVGKQCEALRQITCESMPCRNGSTCTDGFNKNTGNNFTCACTKGMSGSLCDTAFCIVTDQHCKHGSCNTVSPEPFCQCDAGFNGTFCEINIDDCANSPCLNGGNCTDGIDMYVCDCSNTGFKGLQCETDIDECALITNRCGKGTCENEPGSFRCVCDEGMCGHGCIVEDPCYENLDICGEHGVCEPFCTTEPNFKCMCHDNFVGRYCNETDVSVSAPSEGLNAMIIVIPIVLIILIAAGIGMGIFIAMARSKRATRGTYSPSAQEFCNPRVELDHVLKPPPEERLI